MLNGSYANVDSMLDWPKAEDLKQKENYHYHDLTNVCFPYWHGLDSLARIGNLEGCTSLHPPVLGWLQWPDAFYVDSA